MVRQAPNIVCRHIMGEHLLVPIRGRLADLQHVFALNECAAFLWEQCDGTHDAAALAGALAQSFAVDPEQARRDVAAFLADMMAADLLVCNGEQESSTEP